MSEIEKEEIIKTKIEPKICIIKNELDKVLDSKTREEGERLHKELSTLSVEDLLRPFTV